MAKLTDVTGIGPATVKLLSEHNIKTVEALASMSLAELQKIPGMSGDIRARAVKKAAADCLRSMVTKQPSTSANKTQTVVKKVAIKKTAVEQPAANQPIIQTEMDEVKDKVKDKKKNKKDDKKEEKRDKKKKNKKNKKKDKKKS